MEILYIFNVLNEHGLTKQDLNLVIELTKEKLKLSQKRYPNFAATQVQLFRFCSSRVLLFCARILIQFFFGFSCSLTVL